MTRTTYFAPERDAEAQVLVMKSRFVCWVRRVEDESAARAVIERARAEHWSASHHCSAFVLGHDGQIARSNDDGEPAGTAGAPMLQVLQRHEVSDVVAVVTRYFGGRRLGTGGLARAYAEAVEGGLQAAGTLRRELIARARVTVPLTIAGRVESVLRDRAAVRSSEYGEFADFIVATGDLGGLSGLIAAETSGLATIAPLGSEWADRR